MIAIFQNQFLRTGNVSELGVFADLVGRPGADGVAVDVDDRLLTHVHPDDLSVLRPFLADLLEGQLEPVLGGLSAAVDLVSGDSSEVRDTLDLVLQLLDLLEVVGHGDLGPYFRVLLGFCGCGHLGKVLWNNLLLFEHKNRLKFKS